MSIPQPITVPESVSDEHKLQTLEDIAFWINENKPSDIQVTQKLKSMINQLKDDLYLRIEQDKDAFAQMVEAFTNKCDQKDREFAEIKRENERLLTKLQNVYKP